MPTRPRQKAAMTTAADSLFGTDGVRGAVGVEPITPQTVLKLGWAAGSVFAAAGHGEKVLIGKDTRLSGYLLESALEAGFSAAGVNVCFLGPLPTPGIAYLTRTARASAGVAISASHNPYYDNGIKIFAADGTKLSGEVAAAIDANMRKPITCVDSSQLGKAERMNDAQGRYIEFCKGTLPNMRSLADLKIVVDCAHGAGYEVAPRVFAEMGAEVIAIGNQPDGFNINRDCGSMYMKTLIGKVREHRADLGIALDGDADRVLLVDANGARIDGDQILYVLAKWRHTRHNLGGGLVGTVMTNFGLELACKTLDIPFARARVGDRYVQQALQQRGWRLGGEPSGHIICLDKSTTGDGIIAALEVLETMLSCDRPLHELVTDMQVFPQCMRNVPVRGNGRAAGAAVLDDPRVDAAVQQARAELGNNGRVVLRPSGTEPVLRVMLEGLDQKRVEKLAQQIADTVAETVRADTQSAA